MSRRKGKSSRELGLEVAAICGTHFLKLEHLHYGYWTDDLDIDLANLHKAQEQYTDFLLSHIPDHVDTILDVGCGTGHTAKKLIDMGHHVDCVSPSPFLNEQVRSLLGSTSQVFECTYEQVETQHTYDAVLFSESFQYVHLQKALEKSIRLLNNGGYLLICDVFKFDTSGNGVMGGGHKLKKFHRLIADYPFELVEDLDITEQTAPNLDLMDATMKNVVAPVLEASMDYLRGRYQLMVRLLRWKYRKQIDRMCAKYFNGKRSAEDFRKFKTYRLLLYKLVPSAVEGKAYPNFARASTVENLEETHSSLAAP